MPLYEDTDLKTLKTVTEEDYPTDLVTEDHPQVYTMDSDGESKRVLPDLDSDIYEFPSAEKIDLPSQGLPPLKPVNFRSALPLNVIPLAKQAKALQWTAQETRMTNQLTGIFTQLPMICKGTEKCQYGKTCPVINRDDFIGSSCPLELMEIFKHFVSYVRQLDIKTQDHTELLSVVDLCRLQLRMWRTDMTMKTELEVVDEVAVVDKFGTAYYKKVINQHRQAQDNTRSSIEKLYRQLATTREQKLNRKITAGDQAQSISVMLSQLTGFNNRIVR
jgi:hypothetical protein